MQGDGTGWRLQQSTGGNCSDIVDRAGWPNSATRCGWTIDRASVRTTRTIGELTNAIVDLDLVKSELIV